MCSSKDTKANKEEAVDDTTDLIAKLSADFVQHISDAKVDRFQLKVHDASHKCASLLQKMAKNSRLSRVRTVSGGVPPNLIHLELEYGEPEGAGSSRIRRNC